MMQLAPALLIYIRAETALQIALLIDSEFFTILA